MYITSRVVLVYDRKKKRHIEVQMRMRWVMSVEGFDE
jgi:hypothetical protein